MTKLGELLDLTGIDVPAGAEHERAYRARIDGTFTIGPKVHGSTLQMLAAKAARVALGELGGESGGVGAIAIASDFRAAPDPTEVDLTVSIVKRGRTVSLAQVNVIQGERTMVSSTVTLGRADTGDPAYCAPGPVGELAPEPDADGLAVDGSPVGAVMHLGSAIDLVLDGTTFAAARGEQGAPVIRGWVRPKDAAAQPDDLDADFPVLVCDVSPPVLMNLGMFGWAPTVQLTTYLRRRPAPGWLRFAASTQEIGQGMFSEDHTVLDSTGAVVAQSRQLALIPQAN